MAKDYQIFDTARLVLEKGTNLVEASAGTGKTYAIAMLVLRSVAEEDIPIDAILIVTFTKAATEELRTRIRRRLAEALELLAGRCAKEQQLDETLRCWADRISDPLLAISRLQRALADIDCAAIFTIHGFCQRMLVDQALESGQLFDVELTADIQQVQKEAAEDYWRNQLYYLEPLACSVIVEAFGDPQELLSSVSLTSKNGISIEPTAGPLDHQVKHLSELMGQLEQWWQSWGEELRDQYLKGIDAGYFKKTVWHDFDSWFSHCDDFFRRKTTLVPVKLELLRFSGLTDGLNGNKFRDPEKKANYLDQWNLPDSGIIDLQSTIGHLLLSFRLSFASKLQDEVTSRLLRRGAMGFDNLIGNLKDALQGRRGKALSAIISKRYSVALIDEFQDTDHDQYWIFSKLFGQGHHFLYLIGDPKQAIYRFRGADIASYFRARRDANTLLSLDKNYRSHPALVEEVNRLFSFRVRPFYYPENILPFHPVKAAKTAGEMLLLRGKESLAKAVYCSLPPHPENSDQRWTSTQAKKKILDYVVDEILILLDQQQPVRINDNQSRTLCPGDIAILVRKNKEAEEYREKLVMRGIPAIVTSRVSVFHSSECHNLLLLLQAIALPGDLPKLKAAMSLSWFGLSGFDLYTIWQNDELLQLWQGKFSDYLSLWRQKGFLLMINSLFIKEELLERIARQKLAERTIANIHQLLELIAQQQHELNGGVKQTLYWLKKMQQQKSTPEDGELLLESDEHAVQLVTMHSAKGLEYPVVFCPTLWNCSDFIATEKFQVRSYDQAREVVVDLGSELFSQRKFEARQEQQAEELRLLYVALTRARLRCYIFWADVKKHALVMDSFDSALGYLLFPEGYCSHQQQRQYFIALEKDHDLKCNEIYEKTAPRIFTGADVEKDLRPLTPTGRKLTTDWQMTSFSALVALSDYEYEKGSGTAVLAPKEGKLKKALREAQDSSTERKSQPIGHPGLPAGAGFGNVIHDLLELDSFSITYRDASFAKNCRTLCQRYGIEAHPEEIGGLLRSVVSTRLPAGFTLAELNDSDCLKEMAFYCSLSPLVTSEINTLLGDEPAVIPLVDKSLEGYVNGFVDLICCYQGRYYLLDYKTNSLGDDQQDYGPKGLLSAMQEHNYGLQYWIYTLVLHRHLGNFLPGYTYHQHFGGVFYLFIRGMTPLIEGSGVYSDLPEYHKVRALDRLIGGVRDV
jgi:exodeoxyribonuclease V beta subunit